MSEFKGTKGKWFKMNASRISVPFIIFNENDETIFHCYREEAEANALLISKAPEMLEMLKWFTNEFKDVYHQGTEINDMVLQAKQLIKEATEL
jgi:hypothetical protein